MSEDEKKAIDMLEKYITEHKLYNIKQSDGLEDNIKILLDLYKQEKERRKIAESKNAKVTLVLSNVLNELYNDTIPGAKTLKIKKVNGGLNERR